MVTLKFKNDLIFYRFNRVNLHIKLANMLLWTQKTFGEVVITSAYRMDDPGVHGQNPLRGLDIRSYIYDDPTRVARLINEAWIYDLDRVTKTCALFHNSGKGDHIHLQVCDKTFNTNGRKDHV